MGKRAPLTRSTQIRKLYLSSTNAVAENCWSVTVETRVWSQSLLTDFSRCRAKISPPPASGYTHPYSQNIRQWQRKKQYFCE